MLCRFPQHHINRAKPAVWQAMSSGVNRRQRLSPCIQFRRHLFATVIAAISASWALIDPVTRQLHRRARKPSDAAAFAWRLATATSTGRRSRYVAIRLQAMLQATASRSCATGISAAAAAAEGFIIAPDDAGEALASSNSCRYWAGPQALQNGRQLDRPALPPRTGDITSEIR